MLPDSNTIDQHAGYQDSKQPSPLGDYIEFYYSYHQSLNYKLGYRFFFFLIWICSSRNTLECFLGIANPFDH